MARIIDTSVILKWVVPEPGWEAATELVGEPLVPPDLLRAELAHALVKKVKAGELTNLQALAAQTELEALVEFMPSAWLSRRALELSLELRHPAYDCFFLALAEGMRLSFITADAKFVAACRTTAYEPLVELLAV